MNIKLNKREDVKRKWKQISYLSVLCCLLHSLTESQQVTPQISFFFPPRTRSLPLLIGFSRSYFSPLFWKMGRNLRSAQDNKQQLSPRGEQWKEARTFTYFHWIYSEFFLLPLEMMITDKCWRKIWRAFPRYFALIQEWSLKLNMALRDFYILLYFWVVLTRMHRHVTDLSNGKIL